MTSRERQFYLNGRYVLDAEHVPNGLTTDGYRAFASGTPAAHINEALYRLFSLREDVGEQPDEYVAIVTSRQLIVFADVMLSYVQGNVANYATCWHQVANRGAAVRPLLELILGRTLYDDERGCDCVHTPDVTDVELPQDGDDDDDGDT